MASMGSRDGGEPFGLGDDSVIAADTFRRHYIRGYKAAQKEKAELAKQ